jgi:hypothetical protein
MMHAQIDHWLTKPEVNPEEPFPLLYRFMGADGVLKTVESWQLRLSPWLRMNDPREKKEWRSGIWPEIRARSISECYSQLQAARRDAVRVILDSGAFPELRRLGAAAVLPAAAGWAAAEVGGDDLADDLVPLLGTSGPDGEIARGYAGARIEAEGVDWVTRHLQRWTGGESVRQQAGLLLAVPRPGAVLIAIADGLHSDVDACPSGRTWCRCAPSPEHGRLWCAA